MDKPYQEKTGGSYVVDAKTGQHKLVETTAQQSGFTASAETDPASAPPPVEDALKPASTAAETEKKGK